MLNLFLVILATYAVSHLVALDEGPFGVFAGLRSVIDPDQHTWVGRGINCPICVSFWVSWFVAWLVPDFSLLFVFATMGGSMFLYSVSVS